MSTRQRLFIIIICVFLLTNLSHAGKNFYKVGAWSEYNLYDDNRPTEKMKWSVVGKDGNGYWIESASVGNAKAPKNIMKMLVIFGKKDKKKVVKRVIIQNGEEPAMEMSSKMLKMSFQGDDSPLFMEDIRNIKKRYKKDNPDIKIIEKNNVKVKVKAGTFKTKYIKVINKKEDRISEIYISDSVYPFGIVKVIENGIVGMELVKTKLTGAKSQIKGKVKKIEMPTIPNMEDLLSE